jgi:hypothetical protein
MYELHLELADSLHFSPFYLMATSAGLKILYSFLFGEYINHIHLLNFLLLPSLSGRWSLLSMT